jgi:hypothetical protein
MMEIMIIVIIEETRESWLLEVRNNEIRMDLYEKGLRYEV